MINYSDNINILVQKALHILQEKKMIEYNLLKTYILTETRVIPLSNFEVFCFINLILFTDTDHNTCKTSFPFFRVYYTIVSDGGALTEVLQFIIIEEGYKQGWIALLNFSVGRSMDQKSEELKCLIKSSLCTKYSNGVIFLLLLK